MKQKPLHSCPELIDYINETGFLPLLSMGIAGWSAEEVTDEDCQYTRLPDGGWEWPLWTWKGALGMERCHPARKRLRIRQVLQGQSRIHQPRVVARLLQLPAEHFSLSGGGKH